MAEQVWTRTRPQWVSLILVLSCGAGAVGFALGFIIRWMSGGLNYIPGVQSDGLSFGFVIIVAAVFGLIGGTVAGIAGKPKPIGNKPTGTDDGNACSAGFGDPWFQSGTLLSGSPDNEEQVM